MIVKIYNNYELYKSSYIQLHIKNDEILLDVFEDHDGKIIEIEEFSISITDAKFLGSILNSLSVTEDNT